jgi:putative ABC transport system permease protein
VDDGVAIGDTITLDRVLTELLVVGITDEHNIGHLPIIYAALPKWQEATYGPPGGAPPGEKLPDVLFDFVSVIALQLDEGVDLEAADESFETLTLARQKFYEASTGYTDEVKSVEMIQWLLIIISAVVIGAFFSIWTIQRTKEIGLVKALGASNGFLMRDALGQALILMLIGTGAGLGFAMWIGSLIIGNTEIPFMYQVSIVMSSTTLLLGAGLIGGFLSILRITSVDPIIALGQEQ